MADVINYVTDENGRDVLLPDPAPAVSAPEKALPRTKSSLVDSIMGIPWAFSSMYHVDKFYNPNIPGVTDLATAFDLDIAITNIVSTPGTFKPIEEYIGGRWVFTNGIQELHQLDITFRDIRGMWLYTSFREYQDSLRNNYPSAQKWSISISSIGNSYQPGATSPSDYATPFINTADAIITNISNITFDASSKDIVTFTVTFRYSKG